MSLYAILEDMDLVNTLDESNTAVVLPVEDNEPVVLALEEDPEFEEGEFASGEETADEVAAGAETIAALEELKATIRSIATENFTPAHYQMVQMCIASQTAYLTGNYPQGKVMPAVESAGSDLRSVALEAAEGFVTRVKNAVVNGIKTLIEWLRKLFNTIFGRNKTYKQQIDALEKQARAIAEKHKGEKELTLSAGFTTPENLAVLEFMSENVSGLGMPDLSGISDILRKAERSFERGTEDSGAELIQSLKGLVTGIATDKGGEYLNRFVHCAVTGVEKTPEDFKDLMTYKMAVEKKIEPEFVSAADTARHKLGSFPVGTPLLYATNIRHMLTVSEKANKSISVLEHEFDQLVKKVGSNDWFAGDNKLDATGLLAAVSHVVMQFATGTAKIADIVLTEELRVMAGLLKAIEKKNPQ